MPRTSGNEEEDAPEGDPLAFEQSGDGVEAVHIAAAEGRVDLHRKPDFVGPRDGGHGAIERTGHAAEGVANFAMRSVEADGEPCQSRFFQSMNYFPR